MIAARIAALGNTTERTSRIYRIAELQKRYSTCQRAGKWRLMDRETGEMLVPEYDDEAMARNGAYLMAACDIDQLYDGLRK